jgi:putative peptide zinc metalloprotease protein
MLPELRQELAIYAGPTEPDGSPTWSLHDPVRNRFFKIGWPVFEILARWELGDARRIVEQVAAETTLDLDAEALDEVIFFLTQNELLRFGSPRATAHLLEVRRRAKENVWQWLLHHYLFFRIPVVRPDRLLTATVHRVRWLWSRSFLVLTLAALMLGLVLVSRQWDEFLVSVGKSFTLAGIVAYGLALAVAKSLHELSHAYTAKQLGCRVPTIGVAFLVMWPLLYTDTTEAWKLVSRRDRLAVAASGMMAELVLAAWSTLAWALLPDGPLRWAVLIMATTTWLSSIAVNASPFMRFDGYYLLSDALGVPNLHARSFALARWYLSEVLFDLRDPPPEVFSTPHRKLLIAFAFVVWTYRLIVFFGIALLVYHFFIKAVGIFLFFVEVGWFIALPIIREIRRWWARRQQIARRPRSYLSIGLTVVALAFLALPWQGTVIAPAVLRAAERAELYTFAAGRIEGIYVRNGQPVRAGELLMQLVSPDLEYRLQDASSRELALDYQVRAAALDPALISQSQSLREQLQSVQAEKAGLQAEKGRLAVTAPFAGQVLDLDPEQFPGQWIRKKEKIGLLRDSRSLVAWAFLTDEQLARVSVGWRVTFHAEASGTRKFVGTVTRIDHLPLKNVEDVVMASSYGGPIETQQKQGGLLVPATSIYLLRVDIEGSETPATTELRGLAHIDGTHESLLMRFLKSAASVLIRELG